MLMFTLSEKEAGIRVTVDLEAKLMELAFKNFFLLIHKWFMPSFSWKEYQVNIKEEWCSE